MIDFVSVRSKENKVGDGVKGRKPKVFLGIQNTFKEL